MLTMPTKWVGGVGEMLTMADKGGRGGGGEMLKWVEKGGGGGWAPPFFVGQNF